MSELLTTTQIQKLLQIDRITVYRMLNDGRLKGIKIGNQWRFERSEIDRLMGKDLSLEESEPRFDTITDFPSDCVQKIQEIFAGILGIGAVAVSLDGEPLTEPTYANPFCQQILSTPEGRASCQASWRKIALKKTGYVPLGVCHAGLSYMRSAIQHEGKNVAWLVAGQFRISSVDALKQGEFLQHLADKCNLPLDELQKAEQKIPVLKTTQLEKVQEWTPKVASTVQSILCERSNLLDRLQQIAEISKIHPRLSGK